MKQRVSQSVKITVSNPKKKKEEKEID